MVLFRVFRFVRGRGLAAVAVVCLAATVPRAIAATIPHESTGALGPLILSAGDLTFFTDSGTYAVNGVLQNDETNRRAVEIDATAGDFQHEPAFLASYDFTQIALGPDTHIRVEGASPLLLLSASDILFAGNINLSGASGSLADVTAGGGGGAGGGGLAMFAKGPIQMMGTIEANGGAGGASDAGGSLSGGDGAAGNAGGGGGGHGGFSQAGGSGGDGGDGAYIGLKTAWFDLGVRLGGGGGGGGGAYDGDGGDGGTILGGAGAAGEAGKCTNLAKGGDGGDGGGVAFDDEDEGLTSEGGPGTLFSGIDGDDAPQSGLTGAGTGGGGGGGGGAPSGGKGGRGGRGGYAGGGGGGGGGGGDVCSPSDKPGDGRSGGGGGGGGTKGESGTGGAVTVASADQIGGGGGGGHVILGSQEALTIIGGHVELWGGVSIAASGQIDNVGGGGVLSLLGVVQATPFATFNDLALLEAGRQQGVYRNALGMTAAEFLLSGGGGGGGAGGDGETLVATHVLGDTNGDGAVDLEDLNNVRNNFGALGLGDTNADNLVDLTDLNNVRNNFGQTTTAVPEPDTIALAAACCLLMTGVIKRRQRIRASR